MTLSNAFPIGSESATIKDHSLQKGLCKAYSAVILSLGVHITHSSTKSAASYKSYSV